VVTAMWWFKEIISCFKFLSVTGTQPFFKSKRVYEIVVPGICVAIAIALIVFWPDVFPKTFLKEFSGHLFQVMVFIVPFHLAALAVFATYQFDALDERLLGTNAQIRAWSNTDNCYFYKYLSLRQYASLLFGYLCSLGIFYVMIYLFFSSMQLPVKFNGERNILHNVAIIFGVFFVIHYMTLTLYAITFLFDKINRIRDK
jgi:hypothetical protein